MLLLGLVSFTEDDAGTILKCDRAIDQITAALKQDNTGASFQFVGNQGNHFQRRRQILCKTETLARLGLDGQECTSYGKSLTVSNSLRILSTIGG